RRPLVVPDAGAPGAVSGTRPATPSSGHGGSPSRRGAVATADRTRDARPVAGARSRLREDEVAPTNDVRVPPHPGRRVKFSLDKRETRMVADGPWWQPTCAEGGPRSPPRESSASRRVADPCDDRPA